MVIFSLMTDRDDDDVWATLQKTRARKMFRQ